VKIKFMKIDENETKYGLREDAAKIGGDFAINFGALAAFARNNDFDKWLETEENR
jgi:hypothetical protein